MTDYTIRGQVIDANSHGPLANLRVEAWSPDPSSEHRLGSAVSDAEGAFAIALDSRVGAAMLDRQADIFFRVFQRERLLADTRQEVLWNVGQSDLRVLIPVRDPDVEPALEGRPFQVQGRVTTEDGLALPDLLVEAWDQRLGSERLLVCGATDDQGRYLLRYDQTALDGKPRADLLVRVRDPRQQRAEVARSAVLYQADPAVVVDLRVTAARVRRRSEYDRLFAAINPLLGQRPIAGLDAAEVTYLAGRTGWDARLIAMAAEGARVSGEAGIPTSHCYALLRSGLAMDTLWRLPEASARRALELAIGSDVILDDRPIDATLEVYRQRALAGWEEFRPAGAVSRLGEMLDISLDVAAKRTFVEVWQATAGQPDRLWPSLAAAGIDPPTIGRLQTDGKLGFITRQNAPVVARLREVAGIERIEDLPSAGLYKAEAWEPIVGDDSPPGIGREAYAIGLAAQVNLAYPSLVVADLLSRGEFVTGVRDSAVTQDSANSIADEVATFLRNAHGRHTIGREPIKRWAGYAALSAAGQTEARRTERLYQLSPSNEAMVALAKSGLDSAWSIANESLDDLVRRLSPIFSNPAELVLIHRKAQAIRSVTLSLAVGYLTYGANPNIYSITGQTAKQPPSQDDDIPGKPTLERLLGNLDYCACDQCRSVLSQAAYFVDLLHFLDFEQPGKEKPLDVLFDRRPDLNHLLLTCENTNLTVPYIDLVNEVLEFYVVNGSLAQFTGHDMREDSNAADLLADPQFIEGEAYVKTRAEVYPPDLPFDMPLAALRLLMQAWDTTLPDMLRVFGTAAAARREMLGLNAAEYSILTKRGFRKLPEYFGEPASLTIDALNDAVADGKTFCRRTGIGYQDLVALLKTRFINPGAPLVPRFTALRISFQQLQSWYTGALGNEALQAFFPNDEKGPGTLDWLRKNRKLFMDLITLTETAPAAGSSDCNFALIELRFALLDPHANRLNALAYHKLLRFIRLWKRLGWSIDLTDRVVTTFLGVPPQALTLAGLDKQCIALLARIANFRWLARRLAIADKRLADWLPVWDKDQSGEVRQKLLAHLLRIGTTDLSHFIEITGIDPLADDLDHDQPSIHRFIDAWNGLKAMKLKVTDVDYLLRHRDDARNLTPDEESLRRDLKALRDALTAVDADLDASPGTADLAYVRGKMVLVYDAQVVDWFIGLVSGSKRYEAPFNTSLGGLPAKLLNVTVDGAPALIGFDPFQKVLTWSGAMNKEISKALKKAADALVLADVTDLGIAAQQELDAFIAAFKSAVDEVANAANVDLTRLGVEYPELKAVSDVAVGLADPAARTKRLVDEMVQTLRGRLKETALRTTLASLLKTDLPLVTALTADPAVLHAHGDALQGVLEDFLGLPTLIDFSSADTQEFLVDPPATDDYIFYVTAMPETRVTLSVAGDSALSLTAIGASGEVATDKPVALCAGVLTPISLNLTPSPAPNQPKAAPELRWRTKAMAKGPIPASRLYAQAAFKQARASLLRLYKAALLLHALPLTPTELRHLAAVNPDTVGLLNDLAVTSTIPGDPNALKALNDLWAKQWARLYWVGWFSALKADEPAENAWVGLLEDPGKKTLRGALVLAGANAWQEQDLTDTLNHFTLNLADLSSLRRFRQVKEAVDLIAATGQRAVDLLTWAVDAPNAALIDRIKQSLRTHQAPLSWRATLQDVNDRLRNQRRDALVAYILHHAPPTPEIKTADQLYEHFLIDVEMDACMKTSRIRLALSTVQLFVTRCLMNLESPAVDASAFRADDRADQWTWMRRYRVWEANRKIFLWPENWLEPELRDNKSPFFHELEADLLKSDITDDLAADAYFAYLKKLDEVARLEIVGSYLEEQPPASQDDDILHVFGRTNGETRQYYYRRYEHGYWTPWEKVTLNIQGDLLLPMMWRNQLYLFWLKAVQKAQGAASGTPKDLGDKSWTDSAKINVELHLGWGEYYQGKWTSPKSSELNDPMVLENLITFEPQKKLLIAARTLVPGPEKPERLLIVVYYPGEHKQFTLTFASKNIPPYRVEGLDDELLKNLLNFNVQSLCSPQSNPTHDDNALQESGKIFTVRIAQPSGALSTTIDATLLTQSDPSYSGYRVRPLAHAITNQREAPLFYSDAHSLLFVNPQERKETVATPEGFYWHDAVPVLPPPDSITIPPLFEKPKPGGPIGPHVNPFDHIVNPNYQQVIRDNSAFDFRGTVFDANGIVNRGIDQ